MQRGWSIVAAIAALGLGFGAGTWQGGLTKGPGEGEARTPVAVTLLALPGHDGSPAAALAPEPFASYREAKPKLEQWVAEYQSLTAFERYTEPVFGERILQRIERAFALASAEELADFIREAEISDGNLPVFEIAFAAFARISPNRAAEAGLEKWAGDPEDYPGLRALLREWEQRDSAGAERWVAGIESEALRESAVVAFLMAKASSDPDLVLSRIGEIDPERTWGIASVIASALDAERLPEAASSLLGRVAADPAAAKVLPPFLASWGGREPGAMLNWLISQDLESIGVEGLRQSLYSVVAADPGSFLEKVTPALADRPWLKEAARLAWWALIATDEGEAQAIEWLSHHSDHSASASDFGSWQSASYFAKQADWTPERTERVLAALNGLPADESTTTLLQDLLRRLAQFQPELVLDFAVGRLPLGSRTDQTLAFAVGSWAESDPEAAVRWSLEHLNSEGARETAIRFAVSKWGDKDPRAAAEMALTLPEKERGAAFWGLSFNWPEKDPAGVIAYLKESADPVMVSPLTEFSFRHFSERHRGTAYLREALSMPPGKMRHDAVRGLFSGWALADTAGGVAALEQIPEGSLRNAAIQGFNGFAIRSDPKLAIELATRISVPAVRDRELLNRSRSWLRQDREAAEPAIRSNPAIPEAVKAELFK